MKKMGFKKIIGTPHVYPGLYENDNDSIKKSFKTISENNTEPEVYFAAEYVLDKLIIDKINNKTLLTLKDNYILIEMSYMSPPNNLYDILFHIKTNDYIPVLAHPERYLFFKNDINSYYKLKKFGCLFQINLLSLTEFYGKRTLELANLLLSKNLIDFTASDIHNLGNINFIKGNSSFVSVKSQNIKKLDKIIEKKI